jgi:hypothetical protein
MDHLRTLLERLGAPGATWNAELAVQARRDEDRLVDGLLERFGEAVARVA